jgi:VWFA-related protein
MRAAIAILIAAAAISAQSAVDQSAVRNAQSAIGSGRLVTIDLIATDVRGRAVVDLKPADFDLREDATPLALESVRLVRASGAADAPATTIRNAAEERQEATADDARLVAMFLDEYHVERANADRVRETLLQFVDRDIGPRDLLAVMKPLDSLFAIRLTRDRDAARATIEGFAGRKGDYAPRNAYEREYIAGTPARIESARNQVALSAVNALAVHLGSLTDRRKILIVASEGVGGSERRRGLEYLPTFDTIVRSATRSNVAIYAFDPSGAPTDQPQAAALRRLADETDGEAMVADVGAGLRRAVSDASAYYLLSFRAPHPDDGKYRELSIRVTRPGVSVRTRKGYWTASPDEALRAALLAKANEPKRTVPPEPAPHVSQLIRPWFGMARGANGTTRVTFVWEPAARVPGERTRQVASRLVLSAKTSDGAMLFEGPVGPTGPAVIDDPAATPSKAIFDVSPGRLRLQMAIQDVAGQVLDRDVREMSIRDLRGDVAIGTPEVMRARNLREFRTLDVEAAVPVATREFSRTERLLIRFQAYGPGGSAPAVSARLLSRSGQPIRDLNVAPSATPGDHAIDLPLAAFANGEYVIEVKANGGARNATDRLTFRVTS